MLEREVKLGAGPAFHLPDLSGVVDGVTVTPPEAVRLETVYYDTPDLRLARWGVSLRHRAGEGWTLKLPPATVAGSPQGALLERDELVFQGGAKKPPQAAVDIVRAYVRKAELVPVARLSTLRRRVRLVDAAGARVAEGVDDEGSVRDGRRGAARFRGRRVGGGWPRSSTTRCRCGTAAGWRLASARSRSRWRSSRTALQPASSSPW